MPPLQSKKTILNKKESEMEYFDEVYVTWATANNTCHRPDIILHQFKCNNCSYVKYCLCKSKRVL